MLMKFIHFIDIQKQFDVIKEGTDVYGTFIICPKFGFPPEKMIKTEASFYDGKNPNHDDVKLQGILKDSNNIKFKSINVAPQEKEGAKKVKFHKDRMVQLLDYSSKLHVLKDSGALPDQLKQLREANQNYYDKKRGRIGTIIHKMNREEKFKV